jgi:hypothetical protein
MSMDMKFKNICKPDKVNIAIKIKVEGFVNSPVEEDLIRLLIANTEPDDNSAMLTGNSIDPILKSLI